MKNSRKYTPKFKGMVILDLFGSNQTMASICEKYKITYLTLRKWKEEALRMLQIVLYKETAADRKVEELEKEKIRLLNELKNKDIELTYLQSNIVRGMRIKDRKSLIELQYPKLSINRQCDLLQISRSCLLHIIH
ncbi:transposase [Alkalihalobacillus sp. BA299]|uniref:transposase n=1 Tax=Alkalihalobacillus sp. BA299 TaxID=2815938 RepID=UPI001ADC4DF1|nr:transposase [Alkalihalobacillus sp. BA299]